jgi:cell division protein FtsW (lipid II flippase)
MKMKKMSDNALTIFEDLSREEQKALRKSFCKQPKGGKTLIIVAIIIAVALVAVTALSIASKYMTDFVTPSISVFFVLILIASRERRFSKWLESEKDITRRRARLRS